MFVTGYAGVVLSFVRRLQCFRHFACRFLLGGLLALSGAATAADGADYWSVCSDGPVLSRQLAPIAARIDGRLEADRGPVQISAVPQGEGSTEYFLAAMADLFAQLRGSLQARKVPLQRVSFQWLSLSAGGPPETAQTALPAGCRGAVLLLEVAPGQP